MGLLDTSYQLMLFGHGLALRKTGLPYTKHPIAVWSIYGSLFLFDKVGQSTCFAHDLIEDTFLDFYDLKSCLGEEVANMVKALSKKSFNEFGSREDRLAEYHRRLFAAARYDPRIGLIKLFDRYVNLKTVEVHGAKKAIGIIRETEEILLPFFRCLDLPLTSDVSRLCFEKRVLLNLNSNG